MIGQRNGRKPFTLKGLALEPVQNVSESLNISSLVMETLTRLAVSHSDVSVQSSSPEAWISLTEKATHGNN